MGAKLQTFKVVLRGVLSDLGEENGKTIQTLHGSRTPVQRNSAAVAKQLTARSVWQTPGQSGTLKIASNLKSKDTAKGWPFEL